MAQGPLWYQESLLCGTAPIRVMTDKVISCTKAHVCARTMSKVYCVYMWTAVSEQQDDTCHHSHLHVV